MKKIFYINILAIIFFAFATTSFAQEPYDGKVNISSGQLIRNGNTMQISMLIDVKDIPLRKNESVSLTPVIKGVNGETELENILINGSINQKKYKRSINLGKDEYVADEYVVVKYDKNSDNRVYYTKTIPYQEWMRESHLDVKEDDCGCGNIDNTYTHRVATYVQKEPYVMVPRLAYIQPEAQAVKTRREQWDAFLDFPVNKIEIQANYMNNFAELTKIESNMNEIVSDNNLTITGIDIVGYASPEGPLANNERLSQGRAEALKAILEKKFNLPENMYSVSYGGENWDGLAEAIERSNMDDADEILDIIRNTENVNTRKTKLKNYKKGVPYRQMLADIYPRLRKAVINVNYTVRGFSVDEAKEIIKTRPQQLSLNELFLVSNTYPSGSNDFFEVFETTVRMYPEDRIANLNAAAAALTVKDTAKAKRYLEKSDNTSVEYLNNMGVLYILNNDINNAKSYFERAAQRGSETARYNLQEIAKSQE